jgi:hypothetical protein
MSNRLREREERGFSFDVEVHREETLFRMSLIIN